MEPADSVDTADPITTVTRFVRLVEERRLGEASALLGADVAITFPGGRQFSDLDDQVASSAGRFREVSKVFERFDVLDGVVDGVEAQIVYLLGTLEGVGLDGHAFAGVRFVDRFVLRDGLIVDQRVWNDVTESGVVRP